MTDPNLVESHCPHCSGIVRPVDLYCGHCGKEINPSDAELADDIKEDVFTTLTPTLLYYFSTLMVLGAYKITPIFEEGIEGLITVSVIDIVIVLIFWVYEFQELKGLFSIKGFSLKIAGLTVAGALLGSVLISLLAGWIRVSISDDDFYNPYLFQDTSYPVLFSMLFICVQPAIFEEVAFRGFLFNNLEKVTSTWGAVYITSFVFGIIHLSYISLLWLVPIGLAFAFLRMKYNTLWYGMIGHFTYNFGIIALDFLGWL